MQTRRGKEERDAKVEGNYPIMEELRSQRYMSPFVDYGFYKLFGTELNKELLISLLNAIFDRSAQQAPGEPRQVVKDLKNDQKPS